MACTQESSQAKASLLSLVRDISEAVGSATRTHVSLSELGSSGTSDLRRTLWLPTSMTLEDTEMCRPGISLVTTALLSRLKRNLCHMREGMLHRVPGGLCKSEYRGAVYDLRWWLIEVAQFRRPRQD